MLQEWESDQASVCNRKSRFDISECVQQKHDCFRESALTFFIVLAIV